MKKFRIIISLTLFAATSFGQKATISDMTSMVNCNEFNCFNTHALACGFALHDSTNLVGTMFTFFVKDKMEEYPPKTILDAVFISADSVECGITTDDKSYYFELKSQMDNMGFVKSHTDTKSKVTWYVSKQYSKIMISVLASDSDDEKDDNQRYYSVIVHSW